MAVPEGDAVVPIINRLQPHFELIVATQDWHPANHGSFAANHPGHQPGDIIDLNGLAQILWPVHCVQNTPGADFVPGLDRRRIAKVFHKGTDPGIDSYSTFFDNAHRKATGLGDYFKHKGVDQVYICGLATDYCVKFSALDALHLGFKTFLIPDACRGINLHPNDVENAIEELRNTGALIVPSSSLIQTYEQSAC